MVYLSTPKNYQKNLKHSCIRKLGPFVPMGCVDASYPWLQDSLRLKIVFLRTDLVWVAQETGWPGRIVEMPDADSSHYKQQVERM